MKTDIAQAVRPATIGQVKDIGATLLQGIPGELSFEMAEDVQNRKAELVKLVREFFFPSPVNLFNQIKIWEFFYWKFFGLSLDFSEVRIPERTARQVNEFTRLIFVASGLKNSRVYKACSRSFPCWMAKGDLDKVAQTNERDHRNGSYAIWVRDIVEADEVHKNKSARMVAAEKLTTETLLERMLHELKYFDETCKHLDSANNTLCTGSRDLEVGVPIIGWDSDGFGVSWYSVDRKSEGARSREVVC